MAMAVGLRCSALMLLLEPSLSFMLPGKLKKPLETKDKFVVHILTTDDSAGSRMMRGLPFFL